MKQTRSLFTKDTKREKTIYDYKMEDKMIAEHNKKSNPIQKRRKANKVARASRKKNR